MFSYFIINHNRYCGNENVNSGAMKYLFNTSLVKNNVKGLRRQILFLQESIIMDRNVTHM